MARYAIKALPNTENGKTKWTYFIHDKISTHWFEGISWKGCLTLVEQFIKIDNGRQ